MGGARWTNQSGPTRAALSVRVLVSGRTLRDAENCHQGVKAGVHSLVFWWVAQLIMTLWRSAVQR